MDEVSDKIENEMKGLSSEIDSKRFSIDEITQFLQTIPEYIDLMRLGGGKSFGEMAAIHGITRQRAHQLVKRAKERVDKRAMKAMVAGEKGKRDE